jgi:hypothetical protein
MDLATPFNTNISNIDIEYISICMDVCIFFLYKINKIQLAL